MDAKDQARLAYQAWEQTGKIGDPQAILRQLEQLQRGLPVEDEFAALCVWSGRCRLVHKLSQEQFPTASKAEFQVPDFVVVFEMDDTEVPVLIEVKSTEDDKLRFTRAYYERLTRYSHSIGLPLVVAWREKYGIWSLFDIREMTRSTGGAWHADFHEIVKQTLMGVLLGEFHATVAAGAGFTIAVRKLDVISETEYIGQIEDAYWHDAGSNPVRELAGNFLPLLSCCPEEVEVHEDGSLLTQRFFTPVDNSVPAHWTMRTALLDEDDPHWLSLLRDGRLVGGRSSVREAGLDGIRKGMVTHIIDIEPQQRPDFLPPFEHRKR